MHLSIAYHAVYGVGDIAAAGEDSSAELLSSVLTAMTSWNDQGLPGVFTDAAREARLGRLSQPVARHLSRVVWVPLSAMPAARSSGAGSSIREGDFPGLAAWCLLQAIQRRTVAVRTCALCKRLWIGSDTSPYCLRPAPESLRSCRAIVAERKYLAKKSPEYHGFRREYMRLYQRHRRGTISDEDWTGWKAANTPGGWVHFSAWKQRRGSAESSLVVGERKVVADA